MFLYIPTDTIFGFYLKCSLLGIGLGYWAVLLTNAAENFGTNLRATVATSTPNFIRGLLVPFTLLFKYLVPSQGVIQSGAIIGVSAIGIAMLAALLVEDRFENDMNFVD